MSGEPWPFPEPDPELLAFLQRPESGRALEQMRAVARAAERPVALDVTAGEREGKRWAGLLLKRSYVIEGGRCALNERRQEALQRGEVGYFADEKSVRLAPPIFVNDYYAARRRTDVVIQGFAFAPTPGTRRLTARARFGKHERSIEVFGARRGEYAGATPRFSEPEPFEAVPIRYDFAYGGVDMVALARKLGYPEPDAEVALPAETELHYPRNPCGLGYLITLDRESFLGLRLPQLEHPFDPLVPSRLAVGTPERWLRAPMPAAWDWQAETWFPRAAYLGMAPPFEKDAVAPAEVKRGWAAKDILEIPMIFHDLDGTPRREYAQAASPGMSVDDLLPDEAFELHHLTSGNPVLAFRLPGEVPRARIAFEGQVFTDLEPHLCSVVVRPDRGEVVMVWSALAEVARTYEKVELLGKKAHLRWTKGDRAR